MKVLIAVTCCAILAAVALVFVQVYRNSSADRIAAAQAKADELDYLAGKYGDLFPELKRGADRARIEAHKVYWDENGN